MTRFDLLPTKDTFGEGNGTSLQYSCLENPMGGGAWWVAVHGVARSQTRLSDFTFAFHALEKEMASHSSVFAWRIPGTGEPGGLPSLGSHRVRHNWSDLAAAKTLQGDIFSFIKGTSLKSPLHINTFITNICHFKNGRVELMSPDQEPFRPDTRKDVTPWKQNCSSSQQLLP